MHKFSAGQAAPKVQYSFEHVSTWFTVESNDQDNPLVWRVTTQLCDVTVALQLGQWEGHDLGTSFQEILASGRTLGNSCLGIAELRIVKLNFFEPKTVKDCRLICGVGPSVQACTLLMELTLAGPQV